MTSPAGTATGSAAEGDETPKVWGRPSGLAVTADGALLIAEDASGSVWRIAYAAADKETEKDPARGPKR